MPKTKPVLSEPVAYLSEAQGRLTMALKWAQSERLSDEEVARLKKLRDELLELHSDIRARKR